MLAGTHRDPQEVVATVAPNMGEATIEKIAINAVMAGCKPEYLPVVITAVEAICTDEFNIHGVTSTTMGASPVIVVNGPIREKIGMNMTLGALGGFAEFEERTPWPALHVERGFKPEDSVVTVFAMTSGPVQIVDQTSRNAVDLGRSLGLGLDGAFSPDMRHLPVDVLLVVTPEHIDTLMKEGPFSKDELRARIQEATARPDAPDRVDGALKADKPNAAPTGAKFASTDYIHIVVAGSEAGKWSAAFHGWVTGSTGSMSVSKKIDLG